MKKEKDITKEKGTFLVACGYVFLFLAMSLVITLGLPAPASAQGTGWEGETGIFVTPMAYTASAEGQKIHAEVSYHYLDAGSVIGVFHEGAVEVGIGKRFEIGYMHEFHVYGDNAGLSPLWQNGFEIFNGKFNILPENFDKHNWIPSLSVGFLARTDVRNVGNYQGMTAISGGTAMNAFSTGKNNQDVYLVGTKVIPTKPIPIILNGGVRGTDAELWGMGGNAPNWEARAFGAIGFVFKLPAGITLIAASEAAQQPHHPRGFTPSDPLTLNIPTTMTYAVRLVPTQKYKLNFDFGIAQIAGHIGPGVNLQARHQAGVQVSYGF